MADIFKRSNSFTDEDIINNKGEKIKFGKYHIIKETNGNYLVIKDNKVIRSNKKSLLNSEIESLDNYSTINVLCLDSPTYGDDTPIICKTKYSNIIMNFLDVFVEDIGLASALTISPHRDLTRKKFWSDVIKRPYPFKETYKGDKLSLGDKIPTVKDVINNFKRIDEGFNPSGKWVQYTRLVQLTDKYVFKKGDKEQQLTELYYYLASSNPFFVPIISAFMHENDLILVQPRIYGEEPRDNFKEIFNEIMGDDFCWIVPTVGLTFYDGVALYAGSSNIIVSDGIPWIYDLGELLLRNNLDRYLWGV